MKFQIHLYTIACCKQITENNKLSKHSQTFSEWKLLSIISSFIIVNPSVSPSLLSYLLHESIFHLLLQVKQRFTFLIFWWSCYQSHLSFSTYYCRKTKENQSLQHCKKHSNYEQFSTHHCTRRYHDMQMCTRNKVFVLGKRKLWGSVWSRTFQHIPYCT